MDDYADTIRTGKGADIAFSVVVLASYFSVFSSLDFYSSSQILFLVLVGVAYIGLGVYGYSYCVRNNKIWLNVVYFITQIILGGIIIYLGKGVGFTAMVLLPLTGHSVLLLTSLFQYGINLLILATYILAVYMVNQSWELILSGLPTFMAGQIFIMVFTQMALTEQKNRSEVERLVHDLSKANQRLRNYLIQVEELATERERNRVAREIHDGLGHYLTTIHIHLEAAKTMLNTDLNKVGELLASAQKVTQEALIEVRKSVAALRNPIDDNIPVEEQIGRLLSSLESIGLRSSLEINGEPRRVEPEIRLTIYRVVQEGINNVCKHSNATEVKIKLDYSQRGVIKLEIWDNGRGSDDIRGGFGLVGLKERVDFVNGTINFITSTGQGFIISASIPG